MLPTPTLRAAILALCAVTLLLAQVLGLHQHRHVELGAMAERHPVALHFADGGVHHEAGHSHSADSLDTHPHVDVDSDAIGDGLAKVVVDLVIAVLAFGALIFWLPRGVSLPLAAPPRTATPRSPTFALRPPSQAPPLSSVAA